MENGSSSEKQVPALELQLETLKRENEALAQQLKRLIRAEGKLYEYQQELDAQLKEYKALYDLSSRLSRSFDVQALFRQTVEYVIQQLEFERAIFLRRADRSTYRACAFDGYYAPSEKESIFQLALQAETPCLAPVMAAKKHLTCTAETSDQGLADCRPRLQMNEFFLYPLGHNEIPHALLVVGNSAENAAFHQRVDESPGASLGMGNLVGLVSSLLDNHLFFERLVQARQQERVAQEALKESEQQYRQLSEALEQRVRETVDELRQKDKMLILQGRQAVMGEMLSNIAHQWRQPLNMLALLVQDLQMTHKGSGLSQEYVDLTVTKTMEIIQQMSRTIDDFRYFFKPDQEKLEFKVREPLEKALTLLEGSFRIYGIHTEVDQTGDPALVGFLGEFIQVLLNILINARDALVASHREDPRIWVRLFCEGGKTVVTIADNGGGIPEPIRDKIFEPYFTTKGPEQGTGIGLFMCKTIIEKSMKGRLTAQNAGEGVLFRIEV